MIAYRHALAIKPDCAEAHTNLGNALRDQAQIEEAIAAHRRALAIKPDYALAHNNLGNALSGQGKLDEAIAAYRRALALNPHGAEIHYNLGKALGEQHKHEEAATAYRQAIRLQPDYMEAHLNLGNTLKEQGQAIEATAAYRRALALAPAHPIIHSNLGSALAEQGLFDEALASQRRAIELQPDYELAHNNLGNTLSQQGRFDEAMAAYHRALALKPGAAAVQLNHAILLLLLGDFERGWPLYEARLETNPSAQRQLAQPRWDGSSLHGRRVLVHAEQGFGDSIHFVRYAQLIAARGGVAIVECQRPLLELFRSLQGVGEVVAAGDPLPPHDFHVPMLSQPWVFQTTSETIPGEVPYLFADPARCEAWRERLGGDRLRLKVGLIWAGGARPNHPNFRNVDQRRSMRLSQFAPLAGVPGVVFVSLQKGPPATQAQTPPQGMTLLDWTGELHDFADTAALVEALDLVISVDTAVAHLAGALGKPVWLLSRFDGCWRWLLDREDSPWYPTMRLFRQPAAGDWDSVIGRVVVELSRMAAEKAQSWTSRVPDSR